MLDIIVCKEQIFIEIQASETVLLLAVDSKAYNHLHSKKKLYCTQITASEVLPTDGSTPDDGATSSSGIPVYVWAVISIAVGGVLIAVILAALVFATRQRKKKR